MPPIAQIERLQAVGYPFDFQPFRAEVEQQTESQAGGSEVMDALGVVCLVQGIDRLYLNQQSLDRQGNGPVVATRRGFFWFAG